LGGYDPAMARDHRPRGAPALDPVLDFLRLLWSVEHSLQRASKQMQSTLGVTGPQRLVLLIVSKAPGISAGELARTVRLHPSTITGVLQRLVRKGLLTREQDPTDTRRVRLRVRHQARSLVGRSGGTVEGAIARELRRVPAAHLRHARLVLSMITAALDAPRRRLSVRRGPRSFESGRG
jgi:DNA-binding MarR family transcriptional regulator